MAVVMEFLEYPDRAAELLHRVPGSGQVTLRAGAQCRVGPHQSAVFFRDGQAADVLHAGKHALTTETLPGLAARPRRSGSEPNRFRAAVYFVSDRVVPAMRWELPDAVTVTERSGDRTVLTARGTVSFRINNAGTFVGMHVASKYPASTRGVIRNLERRIAHEVGAVLERDFTSWESLPAKFNELATESRLRLKHALGRDGIELIDFFITAIDPLQRSVQEPTTEAPFRKRSYPDLGKTGIIMPPVSPPASASGIRKPRRKP